MKVEVKVIKYTLFENAIDSIIHGIEHLELAIKSGDKKDFKYSLLHLFQGAELLLKEVLVLISPVLIFDKNSLYKNCADPSTPTVDELYNCKSIDINEICSELKKHYPKFFDNSARKIIENMAKERNKLQHFAIEFDSNDLKSKIIQLYGKVITPCYKILNKQIETGTTENLLEEKLEEIYCFHQNADNEEAMLKVADEDYARGVCFKCNNYSMFIFYDKTSYPVKFYCTSCDLQRNTIDVDEFNVCPECGVNALIYDETLQAGTCLWHKCANHRDGGILIDMEYCEKCKNYKIENQCMCNINKN
jgi:hypothetical protein